MNTATNKTIRIETTTAQRLAMLDAIRPDGASACDHHVFGRLSQSRGGCQSVNNALVAKGFAERFMGKFGNADVEYVRLTPAGIEKARAIAAVFTVAAPCYANKFKGALVLKAA